MTAQEIQGRFDILLSTAPNRHIVILVKLKTQEQPVTVLFSDKGLTEADDKGRRWVAQWGHQFVSP